MSGVGDGNNTNCGAFVSYMDNYGSKLVLENCHADNVKITATQNSDNENGTGFGAAGLVGYVSQVATVSITNCSVSNCEITNKYGNAAGIIGHIQLDGNVEISNCTVKDCKINGKEENKQATIVGTIAAGTATLTAKNCTVSGCTTDSGTLKTNGRCFATFVESKD